MLRLSQRGRKALWRGVAGCEGGLGRFISGEATQPVDVTYEDIARAAYAIRPEIPRTPSRRSARLSALLDCEVILKNEFVFPTGSFKERGARYAVLCLSQAQRQAGVIAASAGNHAQALARHALMEGVPCTVVMPTVAPLTKVQNCRDLGAEVLLEGEHLGESREFATQLAEERGLAYVNGYDDPHIIAGAGTMGLEIAEDHKDADAVIVPVGGAGLIAGTALALKTLAPHIEVIGVEPTAVASFAAAKQRGHVETIVPGVTLADGLLVPRVGVNAFHVAKDRVDTLVTTDESYIALAMLRLLEMEKVVVEGGGAVGLAAMLQNKLPHLRGKKVVMPLCGGNVDTVTIGRVIERGLAADGRLMRIVADILDRPGSIANLTRTIADCGVSIREIFHERAFIQADLTTVRVTVIVETTGVHQGAQLLTRLNESPRITVLSSTSEDPQLGLFPPPMPSPTTSSPASQHAPSHPTATTPTPLPAESPFYTRPDGSIAFYTSILTSGSAGPSVEQLHRFVEEEGLQPSEFVASALASVDDVIKQHAQGEGGDEDTLDQAELAYVLTSALPNLATDQDKKFHIEALAAKLFGFFDVNVDGTISKDEAIAAFDALFGIQGGEEEDE